jgi:hypothetical protein
MLSLNKIVSSEDLVMKNQPKKEMNLRRPLDFLDSMNINRLNPSKVDNGIQRADTINPICLILLDHNILLSSEIQGMSNLQNLIPLK